MIINKATLTAVEELATVVKVTFHLTETTEDDLLRLEQMKKTPGWLLFNHDEFIMKVEQAMKNRKLGINEHGKSKSEIMRGKIFRYWSECYQAPGKLEFEEYYRKVMDAMNETLDKKYNATIQNSSDNTPG